MFNFKTEAKKFILLIILPFLFIGCLSATKKFNEHYYQTNLCNKFDGKMEYVLKDRTRVDCLTNEYAIEVDFAKKWAESIGQSLYYAHMTNKKPAVGIIMDAKKDKRYFDRLNVMAKKYNITILIIDKEEQ
jgi:hypothetical protein